MNKKKTKRVNTRSAIEGEIAAKREKFFQTGAPTSLLMLLGYVVIAGGILVFSGELVSGLLHAQWVQFRSLIIVMALMLMLSVPMGLYIAAYEPRIVKNHLRGGIMLASLLIMIALVRVGVLRQWSPYLIIIPVMITAITMTIAYSQRFAVGVSSYLALVSVLALRENDAFFAQALGILLVTGSGMGIAVLSLKEVRTRSKLIEVCGWAGLVVFCMVWVVGLWQELAIGTIFENSVYAAVGAVAVGFVIQGLLPVIERVFRTATNMTLLDYSEATKPLLRRLAVEAPGTFNHSWVIGMLAEAAAETIGANGLLCRVGSYYHDVGKLNKPRYFVENQAELFNQHKELSPTISRMIIVGHVKDGLELAHEYHLPRVLRQFIASHHGTTLVEYFYHEAAKQGSLSGQPVTKTDFRYPGPKPGTREAAIVMLADAVEGATRAMPEPTPSRIESIVANLAMKRLQDGQFDNCDLTMRQLRLIEDSLVRSLCAMYHGRIAYPKSDSDKKRKTAQINSSAGMNHRG